MSAPIGFVLITHNQPLQIASLCRKLSSMFDHPPIAIHHDYSQSYLDPATLPRQVRIVQKWVKTSWGASSVIDGHLSALRLLHESSAPEWTMNLSAADYPIQSAETILQDLQTSSVDAFLDFREITHGLHQPSDARSHASSFQRPTYLRLARKRYLAFKWDLPPLQSLLRRVDRPFYVNHPLTTTLFAPFSRTFRAYAGDWWHAVNRRAVSALLEPSANARRLRRFYQNRDSAEESYLHTVLLNTPQLRVENNNLRYTIWPVGAPHPKALELSDVPAMVASGAHFARKFPYDPALFEAVDAAVAAQQAIST